MSMYEFGGSTETSIRTMHGTWTSNILPPQSHLAGDLVPVSTKKIIEWVCVLRYSLVMILRTVVMSLNQIYYSMCWLLHNSDNPEVLNHNLKQAACAFVPIRRQ